MVMWVSLLLRAVKYRYNSFPDNSAHKVSWPLFCISTIYLHKNNYLEVAKL